MHSKFIAIYIILQPYYLYILKEICNTFLSKYVNKFEIDSQWLNGYG